MVTLRFDCKQLRKERLFGATGHAMTESSIRGKLPGEGRTFSLFLLQHNKYIVNRNGVTFIIWTGCNDNLYEGEG